MNKSFDLPPRAGSGSVCVCVCVAKVSCKEKVGDEELRDKLLSR